MKMIKNLLTIYKINVSTKINGFLYYFKKLPIIKKKFKNTNYSFLKMKNFIGIISIPYKIISTFINSFLVFLLAMFLPSKFIAGEKEVIALSTFIVFFYYIFRLFNSNIISYDFNKFIMVKQMRMSGKDYSLATTLLDESIGILIKAIIFTIFLNLNPYSGHGIILSVSIFSFALFSEAVHLYLYEKYDFLIAEYPVLLIFIYLSIYGLAYIFGLLFYLNIFTNILINPIFITITIILGIIGSTYIYKYNNYNEVINKINNIEKLKEIREITKNVYSNEVKIKEKDYRNEDLSIDKFNDKEGFNYLNSIFFDRHKRIVYRPMIIKSVIIIGLFIIYFIISKFFYKELGPAIGEVFYKQFNLFVFAMYLLCNSQRIIKSMFYNCDSSLLRYGFYKKGDALLQMFFLRLLRIIYSNIIPTTILSIGIGISIIFYTSISFTSIIPIILLLYALAIFFSVHYIFMYYIFQPFSSSMKMKSPFYGIINSFIYVVSYLLIQISAPPIKFLPIVIGLLVLYIIISIILVYKKAPKTFRIR